MTIIEFDVIIKHKYEHIRISYENFENQEKHRISLDNFNNYENNKIIREKY